MIYLYLVACLFFIILQGFFAASEISFIFCSTIKLRNRQNKGDKAAKKVYELIANPEKFLATTLVGTNISVVLSSSLLTFFLIKLGIVGSHLWITFIFTPFVVIFAELIPKNIGRFFKEDFSCKTVSLVRFFEKLFLPFIESIEAVSRFLIGLFIKRKKVRSLFVTKEEIKSLVKEIEKEGGIDRGEKEAIEEVFEFKSDKIKDICLEVKKIIAFDYTDPYSTLLEKIRQYRFTRYPVFRNREITGYINVYDLFYSPDKDWQKFIRPITKIGFNQKLQEAFTLLQAKKENIALVLKGKKAYGIITIQDIIKEVITSIIKG
jgi:putative hemolysin